MERNSCSAYLPCWFLPPSLKPIGPRSAGCPARSSSPSVSACGWQSCIGSGAEGVMHLELLSIKLRQRSPWEAMDLGIALLRRHAAAVWRPWFGLTLPFFVFANLLAWSLGKIWLAALFMWWLKPLFDRVPLYVLSRAVFGTVPGVRQTLRSRELWSSGPLFAWLTWRRL